MLLKYLESRLHLRYVASSAMYDDSSKDCSRVNYALVERERERESESERVRKIA